MNKNEEKCLQNFIKNMRKKLRENDCKFGWGQCKISYLLLRLNEEAGELIKEYLSLSPNNLAIQEECADIANFAMMIASNTDNEDSIKKEG